MTNTIVRSAFRSAALTSVNSRFVRRGQIPSLSRRDGVKFLTIRISRVREERRGEDRLPFYLHEILLRRESTRRSGKRGSGTGGSKKKRHSTSSPRGADRTCTESTLFSPLESRGGKSLVPRANFGKHRR